MRGLDERIRVLRLADIDTGVSQAMHDLFWRRMRELADSGRGSPAPETECGKEGGRLRDDEPSSCGRRALPAGVPAARAGAKKPQGRCACCWPTPNRTAVARAPLSAVRRERVGRH